MDHPSLRLATRGLAFCQFLLGLGAQLFIALPFLRRAHGLDRLDPNHHHLFVCNHVSLLDTILLGALCWSSRCYPILVFGDRRVWHGSWLKKLLSSRIGFLIERGKLNPHRIEDLQAFGGAGREFQLVMFPEGTRGDGVTVAECQPGIYYVAQAARLPIVPVFFENMQLVSSRSGGFHFFRGWRKVEVHFGATIAPEQYLNLSQEEFLRFIRERIAAAPTSSKPV
jgi:1-acyl-sn-glycerol-3-phosphate acyltransferase